MEIINQNDNIRSYKILDGTKIKLIAIILMFFDHVHQMYAHEGAPLWLTMLGRPVFVMFLFLAADAFYYTSNRRKYLTRLLCASLIMSIGSKLLQYFYPNPNIILINNAFSTFFITCIYMQCWDWFIGGIKERNIKKTIKGILISAVPFILAIPIFMAFNLAASGSVSFLFVQILVSIGVLIPNIITVEGGYIFVLLGLLFYIFRNRRIFQIIILLIFSFVVFLFDRNGIQWMMCFAAIPMFLYNGERGRGFKNLFYIFYPLHIWLLYLFSTLF